MLASCSPALAQVNNKDVRRELCYWCRGLQLTIISSAEILGSYLEIGEYVFDFAVVFFGVRSVSWFYK